MNQTPHINGNVDNRCRFSQLRVLLGMIICIGVFSYFGSSSMKVVNYKLGAQEYGMKYLKLLEMLDKNLKNNTYGYQNKHLSCMNDIFDKIFVISIPSRIEKLRKVMIQLNILNIDYVIWEGHNANNNKSVNLYKLHRGSYDDKKQKMIKLSPNEFYLRQTQIDIIKYCKENNISKILLLEDDIILSNEYIISKFCRDEKYLPEWYLLGLGINDDNLTLNKHHYFNLSSKQNIDSTGTTVDRDEHVQNTFKEISFKYIYRNHTGNWGSFAIGYSYQLYDFLIDTYDIFNENGEKNGAPIDALYWYIPHDAPIRKHFINIYPTLVIPDVRTSDLRIANQTIDYQIQYLKRHSDGFDINHFTQFWDLYFSTFDQLKNNHKLTVSN